MYLSLNSLKNKYEEHKNKKASKEELGHIKLSDLPTKESLGIDNIDNTSDIDKPISRDMQNALDNKVDKSQVLTDVPVNAKFTDTITRINGKTGDITKEDIVELGIPSKDTIYIHPENHDPSIISQDSNHRFVTDLEKEKWNNVIDKADKIYVNNELDKKSNLNHSHSLNDLLEKDYNLLTNKPLLGTASSKDVGIEPDQIPILNNQGKLNDNIIPKIAISETFLVSNEEDMLSLNAEIGDICIRTDLHNSYILKKEPSNLLDNWQELITPQSPVQSVNGKVGAVLINKDDIGLNNVDNVKQATKLEFDSHTTNNILHITSLERDNWEDANSKKHDHTNKTVLDKITQNLIDNWNNAVTHISDAIKHITKEERIKWNTVDNKVDKIDGKGLSTEDYSTIEKDKLARIQDGANNYIHPASHPASMISESTSKRFVSDEEKDIWNAKSNLTLGTTLNTAYRGDLGNIAYNHSQSAHAPIDAQKNSDITKSEIEAKLTGIINTHSHTVTKTDVGLGSVQNYGIATQDSAEVGTSNTTYMTPLRVNQAINAQAMKKGPLTWNDLKGL